MNQGPHIVIIGANFAGLAAAQRIGSLAEVTLIDPSRHFEFIPNIHELVSARKVPTDLRLDRGKLIQKLGHRWLHDRVIALDPSKNQLQTAQGETVSYDACVLATGGTNNYFGVKGAAEHAFPFKSVADCYAIGNRFRELQREQEPFSVVIVGAGSEGVEALGEMLRKRNLRYPMQIHLVEGQGRLLPELPAKTSREILRLCKMLPVRFHFGQRIEEVKAGSVVLADGSSLDSDLTIWTGGVKPNPLLHESGLTDSANDWVTVNSKLQSLKYPNVFVAGDAADLKKTDSKQAYFAMESGERAGANALHYLQDRKLLDFSTLKRPYLYSFGDLSCFLIYENHVLAGTPLAALKEGIYQKTMIDMQNLDSCDLIAEVFSRGLPSFVSEASTILDTFLEAPLDFIFRPAVRLL
jgi:NADH dehydrogenase FAD-containing subunit